MTELLVTAVGLTGGLESSKAKPEPGDFQRLDNFAVFRGRFALRAPIFLTEETDFLDDQGTPAAITHLLATAAHINKLYTVGYSTVTSKAYLYECPLDGTSATRKGTFIWSTGTVPRPVLASFEGGSATGGTARLYIADYDEQQDTKFWDGTTIQTLTKDFDNSGSAENVRFHYVIPYQFHVWGAGFYQGSTARKEMLRFSQPGLIPADDPDETGAGTSEWFIQDHRSVGRRGDKITAMGLAGGSLIIYKYGQTFALFGYDRESWAVRMLTERSGAVGPYAAASTGDGLCFAWAERGPVVTDGQTVDDSISEHVRKHVLEAEVSDKTIVAFSPDDGLVYFIYPRGGSADPDRWLAYDKERKLWTEGEWIATGGGILKLKHAVSVPPSPPPPAPGQPGGLPSPVAAPSALALTVVDEDEISLSWTNGDTALDTKTEVYRDTASPANTLIATLDSGVATYTATGLTSKTTYFLRVRHKRNEQFSGYSNEPSAKTKLQRPSAVSATRITSGVRVTLTNNEAGADIPIERSVNGTDSWTVITTLLAQTTGVKTYDDTSGTCGTLYDYRVKVTKAGETDSAYSDLSTAVACEPPAITAASHTATIGTACTGSDETRISLLWVGTNIRSEDIARVSRDTGEGFSQIAEVPANTFGYVDYSWRVRSIGFWGSSNNLQYRIQLVINSIVVSTADTTLTNHSNLLNCI